MKLHFLELEDIQENDPVSDVAPPLPPKWLRTLPRIPQPKDSFEFLGPKFPNFSSMDFLNKSGKDMETSEGDSNNNTVNGGNDKRSISRMHSKSLTSIYSLTVFTRMYSYTI